MYVCMYIVYMYFTIVNLLILLIYYYFSYYYILNNFSILTMRWLELGPSDYEKCAFTTWAMEDMLKIREWYCHNICIFMEGDIFLLYGTFSDGMFSDGMFSAMGRLVPWDV